VQTAKYELVCISIPKALGAH